MSKSLKVKNSLSDELKTEKVGIRLTKSVLSAIDKEAETRRWSRSILIEEAVLAFLT